MNHPNVAIAPITSSAKPYALKLGTKLLITITIENVGEIGNNYQLLGSDLSPECYTLDTPAMSADDNHHAKIEIVIHPTPTTTIGKHHLHLKLQAANEEIIWEDNVYLQFLTADDIEITLTPEQTVVEDGVGLYQLAITNTSDLERVLTMQPKGLSHQKGYLLKTDPERITLGPDATQNVDLMVQPQRWWLRPWFGKGRNFQFQVDLEDNNGVPLPQSQARGSLLWQPYPRGHSLRLLGFLLVMLATSSALLWQVLLNPRTRPSIAALKTSQGINPQTGQEDIQLNWTVENGQKLSKLVLLRESQDGTKTSKVFWFKDGIPQDLKPTQSGQTSNLCQYATPQTQTLTCQGITTSTPSSGNYKFELQAFSARDASRPTDVATTDLIAFTPNTIPQIVKFYAPQGQQQANRTDPKAGAVASATFQSPVRLNWDITNPGQITEIQILTVGANNNTNSSEAALTQRYSFQSGKLPTPLAKFCTIGQTLTCRNLPTPARKSGEYFFTLNTVYQQDQKSVTSSKSIGPIQVKTEPLRIASLLINGKEAPAQYVLPEGQNNLDLTWKVVGGNNPTVSILPNQGQMPASGSKIIKVNPQQDVLRLLATDRNGQKVMKSVQIQGKLAQSPPSQAATQIAQAPTEFELNPPLLEPAELIGTPPFPIPPSDIPAPSPQRNSPPVAQKPAPKKPQVVSAASSEAGPQYTQKSLTAAQTMIRGLVIARQKGKIVPNGPTWNKTQDAITLVRRGYSHQEAAQRAKVPLWKIDILTSLGEGKRR